MTPARKKRLSLIFLMLAGVAVGVTFALKSFNDNIMFFFSPDQVVAGEAPVDKKFRIGGLVVVGSVSRPGDGLTVNFDVAAKGEQVRIKYTGILPDLFREGQGIIANGKLNAQGEFIAEEVLAKHDENYMAPEVAEALEHMPGTAPEDLRKGI